MNDYRYLSSGGTHLSIWWLFLLFLSINLVNETYYFNNSNTHFFLLSISILFISLSSFFYFNSFFSFITFYFNYYYFSISFNILFFIYYFFFFFSICDSSFEVVYSSIIGILYNFIIYFSSALFCCGVQKVDYDYVLWPLGGAVFGWTVSSMNSFSSL